MRAAGLLRRGLRGRKTKARVAGLVLASVLVVLVLGAGSGLADEVFTVGSTQTPTLADAVAAAEAASGDIEIDVPAGTYTLSSPLQITVPSPRSFSIIGQGTSATDTSIHGELTVGDGSLDGTLSLSMLELSGATSTDGGAIDGSSGSTVDLDDVVVDGNTATAQGGGIFTAGALLVQNSLIAHNSAGTGGGGLFAMGGGDSVDVQNTTIADNTAVEGGGVYAEANTTLQNDTLAGNTASTSGAGIYGSAELGGTILDDEHSTGECNSPGTITYTDGYNIASDTTCSSLTGSGDLQGDAADLVGGGASPTLADNGGPTDTIAIASASSPAVGAQDTFCPTTDQRGVARSTPCDVGAFQSSFSPTCDPGDAYSSAVLADDPSLYYPLDDTGSGLTMCDASGNALDGSYNSTGVTYGVAGPLHSDSSEKAVAGDGSSSSLLGQGGDDGLSGDVSFTLEGWYRSTGTTPSQILVGLPALYAFGLGIWHDVSCGTGSSSYPSTLGLDEHGVSNCWDTSTVGVNLYDESWHYLAISYDSTSRTVTAYVDGRSLGAQPLTAVDASTQFTPNAATYIGNWTDNAVNQPWRGDAAQIAIYGTALSSSRIQAHYTAAGYTLATSSDATLSALALSAGTISPAFASSTTSYTLSVPNSTSSTTVTATSNDANAALSLTAPSAGTLTSGSASSPIALAVGANTITVHSVAQDGTTTKDYTVTVTRAAASSSGQTITFSSANPSPVSIGAAAYHVAASSTSGLSVALTLDGTSTGCTLSAGVVTFTATGTCVIDANQAGNGTYTAAAQVQQTIVVGKESQTVSFTSTNPSPVTVGASSYHVVATATSGLTPAITLDATSAGCTLSSGIVSFTAAGTCVVDANQPGNSTYAAAVQVQERITITQTTATTVPLSQVITFSSTNPSPVKVGATGYLPAAFSTSGLPVAITLDPSSTGCGFLLGAVIFTGGGTCVLDANQAGNSVYLAAAQVQQSISIGGESQTASFLSTNPSPVTFANPDATYLVRANATSGLDAVITVDASSTAGTCTRSSVREVSGAAEATVTFAGTGTCVLDATQPGNDAYAAAPTVQQTITVALASGVPGVPEDPKATSEVKSVDLSWAKPTSTGGKAITGYTIEWRLAAGTGAPTATTVGPSATTATVTGLQDGQEYEFAIAATNANGTGQPTAWIKQEASQNAPPPEPTLTTSVSNTGLGQVDVKVSWTNPTPSDCTASACKVSSYAFTYEGYVTTTNASGVPTTSVRQVTDTVAASKTSDTILYPANLETVPFSLVAKNSEGSSPAATTDVLLEEVPPKPAVIASAGGPGEIDLRLLYRNLALTGFVVSEAKGQALRTTLPSSAYSVTTVGGPSGEEAATIAVTGLDGGTPYQFWVSEKDASGTGDGSDPVTATTIGPAAAPSAPAALAGNGFVALDWAAPSADGGSPVTGYEVYEGTSKGGEGSTPIASTTSTSYLARLEPRIVNGTTYYFTVEAVNAAGNSVASAEVSATPEPFAGAPSALTATPGGGQVSLSWTAPASSGGSAIAGYDVYEGTASDQESRTAVLKNVTGSSVTVNGLTAGTQYFFFVAAVNGSGAGPTSNEASATPTVKITPPGAPTGLTAFGGSAVLLHWTPPADDGNSAVTDYAVYYGTSKGGEGANAVEETTSTQLLVRNDPATIHDGTTYWFEVAAVNAGGTGAKSNEVSATPEPVPGSPTGLTATAGNGKVTLSWTAPSSTGGSALTGYEVYDGVGAVNGSTSVATVGASATTATVTGLTSGTTYSFEVVATNSYGPSYVSAVVSAMPVGPPGAPVGVTVTPGPEQAAVSWTAPQDDGGSAVTGYVLLWRVSSGRTVDTVTVAAGETEGTVTGLTNGTDYDFAVEATNAIGTGAQSSWQTKTPTPDVRPLVPGDLTATVAHPTNDPENVQVTLTWVAPADGGCASANCKVSGYTLDYTGFSSSHGHTEETNESDDVDGAALTTTVTLPDNHDHDEFDLVAKNHYGSSDKAQVQIVLEPLPPKPAVTATVGDRKVILKWSYDGVNGTVDPDSLTGEQIYEGTSPGGESSTPVHAMIDGSSTAGESHVVATVEGLTDGTTYYFTVADGDDAGDGPASDEVSATPVTVAGAPTGLMAVAGNGQVTLKWKAPSQTGGGITGYDIYAGPGPGEEGTHPIFVTSGTATSVTLTGANGIYNGFTFDFYVTAADSAGQGPWSNEVAASPIEVPTSPTNVVAIPGNGGVSLSWTAPGGTVTGYDVYEGTTAGGEDETPVATPTGTSVLVDDPALANGTTYYFVVRGVNSLGVGNPSSEVSTKPAPVPASPTSLVAKVGDGKVTLTWAAPSSTGGSAITGYDLYEGTAAGGESPTPAVKNIAASATTVTVSGLTDGTAYFFDLVAFNATGPSIPSAEASATPGALPGAPTNVVAVPGNRTALLRWQAPAADGGSPITGYDVYYGTSKGGEGTTVVASTTSTSALVRNDPASIDNGSTYYFDVRAVNSAGPGAASSEVSATPAAVPAAPTNLAATAGDEKVTLSWTAPGGTVTGYDVYEGVTIGGEGSAPFMSVSGSATSATVTGLAGGTGYYFYVEAKNANGSSYPSDQAATTTEGPPGVPTDVKLDVTSDAATIFWGAPQSTNGSGVSGYTVLWQQGTSGTPTSVAVSRSTTSYDLTGLTDDESYRLAVEATNTYGTGPASTWLTATPSVSSPPPAPSLTATVSSTAPGNQVTVDLSWTNPTTSDCSASSGSVKTQCTVSGYTLTYDGYPNGGAHSETVTYTAGTLSATFHLPWNGDEDTFSLTAKNARGASPAAKATVELEPAPTAPLVLAVAGSKQVTLNWTDGDTTEHVTGQQVYEGTSAGGESSTPLPSSALTVRKVSPGNGQTDYEVTVTGLTSGTAYYFTVTQSNSNGAVSQPSTEVSATAK